MTNFFIFALRRVLLLSCQEQRRDRSRPFSLICRCQAEIFRQHDKTNKQTNKLFSLTRLFNFFHFESYIPFNKEQPRCHPSSTIFAARRLWASRIW
jgi:hypothetical protein